jgi:ABC-type Co2+ transport system permease subunit
MVLFLTVVLNAPPAFNADTINVPLAAVAGKEIKLPALALDPAFTFPAVADTFPVVAVTPVPPVTVVPAATEPRVAAMFPAATVIFPRVKASDPVAIV